MISSLNNVIVVVSTALAVDGADGVNGFRHIFHVLRVESSHVDPPRADEGINLKRNSHVDFTSVNIRILWRESLSVEKRFNLGNKGANGFNATASHSILNQLLSTNLGSTQLKLF